MADTFSKEARSDVMRAVLSQGNRSTEMKMVALFQLHGITGWRRKQELPGKPDFVFRKERIAVFVDGCFWHSCPLHLRAPASNVDYWNRKLERNRVRDRKVNAELRSAGWTVVRIWEHAFAKPGGIVSRLKRALRTHREPVKGSPSATHATKPETKRP